MVPPADRPITAVQGWSCRAQDSSLRLALWVSSGGVNDCKTLVEAKSCQRGKKTGRELLNKLEQSEKERWNLV